MKGNKRIFILDNHKPSFDFLTDKEEIKQLKKKCAELENEIIRLSNKNV